MDLSKLLPTMAEVDAARTGPILKGKTRLEACIDDRKLVKVDEKAFKATVWTRDRKRCRCCGRKVEKVMGRVPERGEVHHIHGRTGDLRFEDRAAMLACLLCHERLTGKVAYKLIVIATQMFATKQGTFTDARHPMKFERVA